LSAWKEVSALRGISFFFHQAKGDSTMANHQQQNPSSVDRLIARRSALVTTITHLESELRQAEVDLDRANRAAETARQAEITRLQAQQVGYEWAALGAIYAHHDQTRIHIRRKQTRPFVWIGMAFLLACGLCAFTKSVLILGLGGVVVFFLWRVFFSRQRILLLRQDVRDLRRRLDHEPAQVRALRREAERAAEEARRLQRSTAETPEQRTCRWKCQTLSHRLSAKRADLQEVESEVAALYASASHP
jgi:hypothetical protein